MIELTGNEPTVPLELLVEVRPRSVSGDLAPRAAMPEEFRRRAQEIVRSISLVIEEIKAGLSEVLADRTSSLGLQSIELEFGIALQAETGVLIVKATAGTTFVARLTLANSERQ